MRILCTGDLHYNIPRSREATTDLASKVLRRGGDVLILTGDTASSDPHYFSECLELFSEFRGLKLLVAGNHDLWTQNGENSLARWTNLLPSLASQMGFNMLDANPVISGDIGFAGNVGWYDYSFRDENLKVPMRFYRAKAGPGRAKRVEYMKHLVENKDDLLTLHFEITSAWSDAQHVRLTMSDEEFVELLTEKLKTDLNRITAKTKTIVAVIHHLPARELVWYRGNVNWDFAAAFLGSQRFFDVIMDNPNVKLCLSGHNHRHAEMATEFTKFISVGSTYKKKVLMEFDL